MNQCYGCILWPVGRMYRALCEGILCTLTQFKIHTPHRSQYAAITLTTSCTASTYLLLTMCVIFSQVLTVAPWWWFPCKPKHVGAVLLILECFSNSTFFNVVCVSWKLKCRILLMHGVTTKFNNLYVWTLQNVHWRLPCHKVRVCSGHQWPTWYKIRGLLWTAVTIMAQGTWFA